jgi:hypothetical protein
MPEVPPKVRRQPARIRGAAQSRYPGVHRQVQSVLRNKDQKGRRVMDISTLELRILKVLGRTAHVQQVIAPVIDECHPRMITDEDRRRFRKLAFDLVQASLSLDIAKHELEEAAKFCYEVGGTK